MSLIKITLSLTYKYFKYHGKASCVEISRITFVSPTFGNCMYLIWREAESYLTNPRIGSASTNGHDLA